MKKLTKNVFIIALAMIGLHAFAYEGNYGTNQMGLRDKIAYKLIEEDLIQAVDQVSFVKTNQLKVLDEESRQKLNSASKFLLSTVPAYRVIVSNGESIELECLWNPTDILDTVNIGYLICDRDIFNIRR